MVAWLADLTDLFGCRAENQVMQMRYIDASRGNPIGKPWLRLGAFVATVAVLAAACGGTDTAVTPGAIQAERPAPTERTEAYPTTTSRAEPASPTDATQTATTVPSAAVPVAEPSETAAVPATHGGCAEYASGEIAEDATNREVAATMAQSIRRMESSDPLPELADLHAESLAFARAIKDIADAQPQEEVANPSVFLIVLPQLERLEAALNDLDPEARARLAAAGCPSDEVASSVERAGASNAGLQRPSIVTYALEGSAIRLNWDPVAGADHYKVYYDDFFDSACSLDHWGNPFFCAELAANVTGTTFVDPNPAGENRGNYYWVVACNRGGCSDIDSPNPAGPIESQPSKPSNVTYALEGSAIRLNWDPVAGADHYKVYYDDFFDSACSLDHWGNPFFCAELAANVTGTTFVDPNPAGGNRGNYYWVVACNRGGCSDIDSPNPATPTRSTTGSGAPTPPDTEADPPAPDGSAGTPPDEPAVTATAHDCPTSWADAPTLTASELLDACGGEAAALRTRTVEECVAGVEDREREWRDEVMASLEATTWPEACRHIIDQVWGADHPEVTSQDRSVLGAFAMLGDWICGGFNADFSDLCGGINLIADIVSALGSGLEFFGDVLEGVVGGVEAVVDAIGGFLDFFGL